MLSFVRKSIILIILISTATASNMGCFTDLDLKLEDVETSDVVDDVFEGRLEVPTFDYTCPNVHEGNSVSVSFGLEVPAFSTLEYRNIPFLSTTNSRDSIYDDRIEPDNPVVRNKAHVIASQYPGRYSVEQICAIYDYMYNGWHYVSDTGPEDYDKFASKSLEDGMMMGYEGAGDCEDFAILMASLIEAIGGKTRIVHTEDADSGHAYAEVYVGNGEVLDDSITSVKDAMADYYEYQSNPDIMELNFFHYNWKTKARWLSLDYWQPQPGGKYLTGGDSWVMWESANPMESPYAQYD